MDSHIDPECVDCQGTGVATLNPHEEPGNHLCRRAGPCRLGYVEYDGYRYCFAHAEFVHEYSDHPLNCKGWKP